MSATLDVFRQTLPAFNAISPVGVEVMKGARGNYYGETVVTASGSSTLTDAAEEIGMSVAARADRRTLAQRVVRQGQATSWEALSRIADYYDKLPNMPREAELKSLVDNLTSLQERLNAAGHGGEKPSKEGVLSALHRFDEDVTHQYAGLEIARHYFEAGNATSEFQLLLDEARAEFESGDVARDVRAGFASAEVAARAAETLETNPADVRDTYRAMLRDSHHMGQLFDKLSKFDVLRSFAEIVDLFMTAAARDLASTGPSTDSNFLHALILELGKLKKMQTVVESSKQLIDTTERLFNPSERGKQDAVGVAGRLLNFTSNVAVNIGDAQSLLGHASTAAAASQVAFANGLKNLHADLPDDVMPSTQARLQQATMILLLLDNLVAQEEREYEMAAATA